MPDDPCSHGQNTLCYESTGAKLEALNGRVRTKKVDGGETQDIPMALNTASHLSGPITANWSKGGRGSMYTKCKRGSRALTV